MTGKATEKDPALKVARHRLSVLEMAKAIGNVSEACRRSGMDRTSFHEWKRRFQTHGIAGFLDQLSIQSFNSIPYYSELLTVPFVKWMGIAKVPAVACRREISSQDENKKDPSLPPG